MFLIDDMATAAELGSIFPVTSMNASDFVVITVNPPDVVNRPGSNNVLTAALASSLGVGAAAAVGVYVFMRTRSPPTSTFFGMEEALANGSINENPLYDGGIMMENSMYRAPTFNMGKA